MNTNTAHKVEQFLTLRKEGNTYAAINKKHTSTEALELIVKILENMDTSTD